MAKEVSKVTYWTDITKTGKKTVSIAQVKKGVVELTNGKKFDIKTRKQIGGGRILTKESKQLLLGLDAPVAEKAETAPKAKMKIKMPVGKARKSPPRYIIRCFDTRNFSIGKYSESINKGEGGYQFDGYYGNLDSLLRTLRQRMVAKRAKDALTVDAVIGAMEEFQSLLEGAVDSALVEVDPKFTARWRKLVKLHDRLEEANVTVEQLIEEIKLKKKSKKK